MSTLEKAYLKAMKVSEDAGEDEKRDILDKASSFPTVSKRETGDILSSRTGISQMSQPKNYSKELLKQKRLIHTAMDDSVLLEKYRSLRTNLLSRTDQSNFSTLITSVVPNSNSHRIAANIAATFALDGAKTSMLIESNIRNPRLNSTFDLDNYKGVIDYLESENWDSDKILYKTGIPRLRFVPSGLKRENSAEYFTTDKMKSLIREISTRYPDRFPVINAPSIAESADTQILIELCDSVVLVVPYGQCSEEEIMHASLAIGEEKLAGVVLDSF